MSLNQLSAKRSLEKVSVFESSSHDERYTYTPLDGRSIRLLMLLPGSTCDELRCSLVTAPLQPCPNYEAVSYCWGNKEPPAYILCEGKYVRITTNLDSGLRQLRHPDEPRVLWADQICINQADDLERSAQVNIMGQIFRQARGVVVWLGSDDEAHPQAPLANSVARKLASLPRPEDGRVLYTEEELEKHGIPPFSSATWAAFANFVRLPYFERVWILQEMYLASRIVVLWGKTPIDLDLLPAILETFGGISLQDAGWTQAEFVNFWSSVDIRSSNRQRSLLGLVNAARRRKAEDPRDLNFALLGMAESDSCQMSADYSKSLVDVYTTAAHPYSLNV